MNTILQQVQQHAAALPLALQAELLNYTLYLEQKTRSSANTATSGQQREHLAEALAQAAALNPFCDIADPVAWQREQRQDRPSVAGASSSSAEQREQDAPATVENQPRLRFPEFQNAGEWEDGELGPKASKVGSGITPTGGDNNYKQAGRPFVRSQNVGWGILLLDDVAYIDEETHTSFDSTEIKVRDVLLNITGASIGRSAVADERIAGGNVNQHVCIIRTKPDELNPFFLNQYLISQRGQKQIDSFQAGGNRQGLNFSQIRSFTVPLPSLPEQQRIASCLSSLDALITAETQKLEALKLHKKGLMQQLFPSAQAMKE